MSDLATFKNLCKGLTYSSESDEPLHAVHFEDSDPVVHIAAMERLADESNCEQDVVKLDEVFENLTSETATEMEVSAADDSETVNKIGDLKTAFSQLSDVTVISCNKTHSQKAIYAVGKMPNGMWVGFKTISVET